MRNIVFIVIAFVLSFSGRVCAGNPVYSDNSLRNDAEKLLVEWVDALLAYQCEGLHPSLDGGILCPACARIHGRIGDTVLPLMYLADKTGNDKYLLAAKKLMKWMENVHRPDGSWMNDVHVSDWSGTTVFAAIALYEAVHYHGHLLDDSTRNHWKEQLLEAGEFMMKNPQMYSRRMQGSMKRLNNVNYSASVTYALQALGEMFDRPDFKEEARIVASDLKKFFTANDSFLYGEGPKIWTPTKNGCLPVDLGYNVEESLPNLAYYALMVNDRELLSIVERSMNTHLEFMLPDGAWDNSWGTRSFKWTYWGGRTSDGFMGGYYAMAEQHPEYLEAIRRNIRLLKKSTNNGLLHAGRDYQASGIPACIHHTFGHAKALTAIAEHMCAEHAGDGEGATHLITCEVTHAPDLKTARAVSRSVVCSNLFKAAVFGRDANWGRILCAIGYTPGDFSIDKVCVWLSSAAGEVYVCENAAYHPYSEDEAAKVLAEHDVLVKVDMGTGDASAKAWGCDLTYDYVKINGDYRT